MSRPERSCIGCRRRAAKGELLRLVVHNARVVVDIRQAEPGRGAYLHRDPVCLGLAVRRRVVTRALRTTQIDVGQLDLVVSPHL
ncbi:MAG TPA: YlxR family protein [Propionibacteriaceae bacterium]|nr:YlxR family protein [Propionibacteriaceae bacterium]